MPYTDIVKARAIRRAGRACEMCGAPLRFDSAFYVSAQPIFGILLDEDDCCVLCPECIAELDPEIRAAVQAEAPPGWQEEGQHRPGATAVEGTGQDRGSAASRGRDVLKETPRESAFRDAFFPDRGPDDDMCA